MSAVDEYLDGERQRYELLPAEREALAPLELIIEEIGERLRAAPAPDLVARVMTALPPAEAAALDEPRWWARIRAAATWLWNPQPLQLRFRPAYGAFALVVLAPVIAMLAVRGPDTAPAAAAAEAESPPLFVQFRLQVDDARHVSLAGSFTDWQPRYELHQTAPGVWTVLVPLQPGVHDYTFVVDGRRWVADPHAPHVPDSFGGSNSRLTLLAPPSDV